MSKSSDYFSLGFFIFLSVWFICNTITNIYNKDKIKERINDNSVNSVCINGYKYNKKMYNEKIIIEPEKTISSNGTVVYQVCFK